ncbi:hypothetical protein DL767_009858 [Monosporascus sp. MG133]|nr:hypothetical protein DL767_009858 [Monosporascus sp. MG133]
MPSGIENSSIRDFGILNRVLHAMRDPTLALRKSDGIAKLVNIGIILKTLFIVVVNYRPRTVVALFKTPPRDIMAPSFVNKLRSRVRKTIGHEGADSRTPQTAPTPSIASESVSGGDKPQPATSLTVTNVEPEPHEPATPSTLAVCQQPSPAPVGLQPISSVAQPLPLRTTSEAANPGFPGRLWTDAYDAIKEDDPRLVGAYKMVLHRELGGESNAADIREGGDDPTDAELPRTQMVRLVEAGLKKTENEAAAKYKVQEGMRVVSSVKELVGTALKHAPEAAAAWGGVCLLLRASANRDGMAYVVSRMNWYWNLSGLLLEENQERAAGLRGELGKHVVALYKEFLSYQMKSVCSCYRNRAAGFFRDVVEFDNWAGAVQSIKDAEKAVQQDIDKYSTQDIRMSLSNIAKQAQSQCTHLQDIHQAIQENTKKQEERRQDDKNEKCLMDLRLTDPRDDRQRIEDTKGGLFLGGLQLDPRPPRLPAMAGLQGLQATVDQR